MKISATKKVEVEAKSLYIHMKVRDEFNCRLADQDGEILKDYEGYVPGFMPGNHFGDYLILDIDIDTGQIKNWKEIKPEQIEEFISETEE